jgi:hypothetical protein
MAMVTAAILFSDQKAGRFHHAPGKVHKIGYAA